VSNSSIILCDFVLFLHIDDCMSRILELLEPCRLWTLYMMVQS